MRLRTRVYAKNGVGPGFFRFCTQEYVRPDTDVVLIEVMQNMFAQLVRKNGVALEVSLNARPLKMRRKVAWG